MDHPHIGAKIPYKLLKFRHVIYLVRQLGINVNDLYH